MSKVSAKVNPVKVTPLSQATVELNDDGSTITNKSKKANIAWTQNEKEQTMSLGDNYNTSSNTTTKRNIAWEDDVLQRQTSSIHRKYASVLKMTKAEYRANKNVEKQNEVINMAGIPFAFHSDDQGRYPIFFDINNDATRASKLLQYMKTGYFIDQQTNKVTVQFMTYNGNTGYFGLVKVAFVYQEDGKIDVVETIRIVDVETYNDTSAVVFRFSLEILFALFMFFEFLWEINELIQAKIFRGSFLLYFQSMWNYIDILSIILQFLQLGMWYNLNFEYLFKFAPLKRQNVYESLSSNGRYLYTGENMTSYSTSPGLEQLRKDMATLETMANIREDIRTLSVICIVLAVLRLLKLLDFQPKLGLVTRTIEKAKNDLAHFILIFILINAVYAICGLVIFGEICESFSTFDKAVETVGLLFMQSNVETIHYTMRESSMANVWGLYFYSFILINVFIMLNILLAILVDAYIEVRGDAQYAPGVTEEMVSIVQAIVQSKRKHMPDKELQRLFKKMAWSNHRHREAKIAIASENSENKSCFAKACKGKKALALPISVVDTETKETVVRVPVVKASGDDLIEYHIDEVFIDKILRDHLANTNVKVEDLEKTLKRMKSALLTRYGKK
eukprot:g5476.t1